MKWIDTTIVHDSYYNSRLLFTTVLAFTYVIGEYCMDWLENVFVWNELKTVPESSFFSLMKQFNYQFA